MTVWRFVVGLLCVPMVLFAQDQEEMLFRHRNLGKAFYENAATQYEAVGEFQQALALAPNSARDRVNYGLSLLRAGKEAEGIAELEKAQVQDPTIPHTWFNLGIAYKRQSLYDKAVAQLEQMATLVPEEAITHYNLGVLYKLERKNDLAVAQFEEAAALDPNLAGPHFQLATAYRQVNRPEDAKTAMNTFRRIKAEQAGAAVAEDLEWSFYSEIYEVIEPATDVLPATPLTFETVSLAKGINAGGVVVMDADGDLKPDLLAWSDRGISLFVNGRTKTVSGLENIKGTLAVVPADFDNDGFTDVCVVSATGAVLYRNGQGAFDVYAADFPKRGFKQAVWLDYDHDYDLDLFLLGAQSALFRNNGTAGFSDMTLAFPFVAGDAVDGVVFDLVADTQGRDLAVVYANRSGVLYRDRLAGKYEVQDLPALAGAKRVQAYDLNQDGWTDLATAHANGVVLLKNDQKEGFQKSDVPQARLPIAFGDFENRATADLVAGDAVFRSRGLGQFGQSQKLVGVIAPVDFAVADFDGDGLTDLAVLDQNLSVLHNATKGKNWLRVGIAGVKNLKLAPGSEIEVKSGARYQKRIYHGLPLLFGLGVDDQADAVRITWANGLIQNETKQKAGQDSVYAEAQRLSGSCPMIFTWNGQGFEFITDVLGVAPLGASAGNGDYFPVDHDEYVQIPGKALVEKDGQFLIRVTEELREVAYIDAMKLIAVDHPVQVDIFTNDKFKGPPFPEFRLFGVTDRKYPIQAVDDKGRDVKAHLLAKDRRYPDGFARDYAGVAALHHLDLDFGDVAPDGQAVLILSGWVDWADGSTFLSMAQQNADGLIFPYLQVKNENGDWETVIADMGLPAGKPKTISVDLSGKFLSASRQVRIVSNLCVYWDEIFLGENPESPVVHMTDMLPVSAALAFRGFSEVVIHPERKQPEYFIYDQMRPLTKWNWNPTPGFYTRYGHVQSLLRDVDDLLVVMGSGDEVQLAFDAGALPKLKAGWQRDFLLFVDGWAKDGDANTAFSQTVTPLPYHGMPQYPYDAPDAFPTDGLHKRYVEVYQSRPALRFIRPLNDGVDRAEVTDLHPE